MAYFESYIITNPKSKYKGLPYVLVIGICTLVGGTIKLSDEHKAYKWVTAKEAYSFELRSETRKALSALENNIS